jgi:hypothetical protein
MRVGQAWTGSYHPTARRLRLVIREQSGPGFRGGIEYSDDGSITDVEGTCLDARDVLADEALPEARACP